MLPESFHSQNKLILISNGAEQEFSLFAGSENHVKHELQVDTLSGLGHTELCDPSSQRLCLCDFSVLKRQNDEQYILK